MERIRNQPPNKGNDAGQINHRLNDEAGEECGGEDAGGAASTPESNAFQLCAICHLIVGAKNADSDQNAPCSKGHALCQRCLRHFAIRAGPGCVLCRIQSKPSSTVVSRESNDSLNSIYIDSKRHREGSRQQLQHYEDWHRFPQEAPVISQESRTKSWAQNCCPIPAEDRFQDYEGNESERAGYREKPQQPDDTRAEGRRCSNRERSCCSIVKRGKQDFQCASELKINGQVSVECSRRPIRCPRIDCAINVAFSALTHHFVFDHPEVPILNVDPGTKSTLIVSFAALASDTSRCLALLLVSGKLSEPVAKLFNGSQINPKYRNRLPLPVLAARLCCTRSSTPINNAEEYYEKDIIIAWVAGLDLGNTTERLRCSIQAVDNIDKESLRSLTYTGPVNSLRSAQRPEDVFLSGDCIVLHEGFLSHIVSDCSNLNVNVIVH